ncbi:hypothetical protein BC833DRAFT_654057 [Globomyces pollinis-pini]|nr:hypothetical protein BC833DRAFT_654057 [Globomyces pollinis-pini]
MTIQKERKKRKLPNGFTSSKPVQKLVSNWFSLDDTDDDLPIKQPIEMVQEYFPQDILGVKVMFPYVPYQSQLDLMKNIILSIENGQNAILESPTGTGKTLSILCSSLSWLEQAKQKRLEELSKRRLDFQKLAESLASLPELNECTKLNNVESDKSVIKENTSGVHGSESTGAAIEPESFRIPKIYITSRTQKQIHQTVSELKSRCQVKPKVSILASREYLCIHHDVKKSSNKNEDCQALKEQGNCIYAQNEKRLAMKDALPEIWDIEDIVTAGKKLQACPYYAARNLSKSADVVFAPYNYIVDPLIRNSMDMELEDSVLIVDEAHNIEQMSMDAASAEISEIEIREVLRVLKVYGKGMGDQSYLFETEDLTNLVNTILNWIQQYKSKGFPLKELNKTFRLWTGNEIHKSLKAEGISFSLLSQLEKSVAQLSTPSVVELPKSNMVKEQIKFPSHAINTLQKLILSLQYVFQETPDNRNEFKVLLSKSYQEDWKVRREFGDYQFALHFWCLNAGVIFSNLGNLCRSVILTSGTLSPIVSYAKELGVHFEHTLEAPHVIPDENLWVGSISSGPDRSPLCGVSTWAIHSKAWKTDPQWRACILP